MSLDANKKGARMAKKELQEGKEEKSGKSQALESALLSIEKQFGRGAIMSLGDGAKLKVDSISTGSISLDLALGIGGLPRGRVVEIFGPESSGKTTLALMTFDAEHALDPEYAKKLGVKIEDLLISQPDNGEQALEITETLIRSNALDVVIVDSVAALVPRAEIEGEMGDSMMGVQARLMSQALRKLTGVVSKSKTILIFINQIRMKIGVMFGNPETTTGGNALKFYSSVRLDIRRKAAIKRGEENIGNRVAVKVVKNKVAPPFKVAEFDLMFGSGVDVEGELIDLGINYGVIEKAGSWLSYGEEKIGQGREGAKAYMKEHKEIYQKIKAGVFKKIEEQKEEQKEE